VQPLKRGGGPKDVTTEERPRLKDGANGTRLLYKKQKEKPQHSCGKNLNRKERKGGEKRQDKRTSG